MRLREHRPVTGEAPVTWLEHFQARVLVDAFLEGSAAYWLRRAEAFAAVGTPACDEIARACHNRAALGDRALSDLLETTHHLTGEPTG